MVTAIARIRIKLRMFPTPRYNKIRNKNIEEEVISPLRELANNSEEVNNIAKNIIIKKSGTAKTVSGSTK